MLVHCARVDQLGREERIAWLVAIVLGDVLGAGFYYFVRYRKMGADLSAA